MHFQPFEPSITHPDIYNKAVADAAADDLARKTAQTPEDAGPAASNSVDWDLALDRALVDGREFMRQPVTERPRLLGEFLRAGDLGFIFAPRGVGKTWLALLMSRALAAGAPLGEWTAGTAGPQRVCYVDGEVNLPDAMDRALLTALPPNVHWLHHDSVVDTSGRCLNLVDPAQQNALRDVLIARDISVLVLDNLSCLFRGMAENEADAWEMVLSWLLDLRRHHITVILVAHAGRNGEMRGTSRREDNCHWILKLTDEGDGESKGAEFKSTFTKNRNARQGSITCPPLLWRLETVDGHLTVQCSRRTEVDRLAQLVHDGITKSNDLAEELGVSKATISRWAHKAEERGLIRIVKNEYQALVAEGSEAMSE